jgi:transposase
VETAKANGLKPYEYITYLPEQMPNVDLSDPAAVDSFLPWSETLLASGTSPHNNR